MVPRLLNGMETDRSDVGIDDRNEEDVLRAHADIYICVCECFFYVA